MLTPSSNTTLEPVTAAMLAGLPEVSAHFGRFRVTEIALSDGALGQFDDEPMLAAASNSAAASIGSSSNWPSAPSDNAISVTRNRPKCADTSGNPASIAAVTGSSVVFDEGVSMPRNLRSVFFRL